MEAKNLGRQVQIFDNNLWEDTVCLIGKDIVINKFSKIPELANRLLSTGYFLIAEAAPRDRSWGIGLSVNNPNNQYPTRWNGPNILGWALMEARDVLQKN